MQRSRSDFQTLLASARRQAEQGNYETADEYLRQAMERWHGEPGGALPDDERQHQRQIYLDALVEMVVLGESRRDYARALAYARELQDHEPRFESLVQRLIHLFVLSESRPRALATLDRRLALAGEGRGALLLISGAAGIGKTSLALLADGWAQTNGAAFSLARAYERGMPPFLLWQDVLAGLERATGIDLAALPEPFGHGAPAESAYVLARAVTGWLHEAAAAQPLVLLLDDLHWADPDSLDLLELVSRHLDRAGILLIATYRGDVLAREHPLAGLLATIQRNRPVETIELQPLDLDGTKLLIDTWLGPCSRALAEYLHRRAEGHPLFLVELLADLSGRNLLPRNGAGLWLPPATDVPVPALLQQVLAQRVSQLGSQAEMLLATAAVAGESWRLSLVEAMLDWPEAAVLDVVERALAARIIVEEDARSERYRFSHGLIREVLYYQQLARRRKRLHGEIAAHLEQEGVSDPAPLADHFFAAEQWNKAGRYSKEAGRLARQRFALRSALRFYYQALHSLNLSGAGEDPGQTVQLHEQIGELHVLLNQRAQAAEAFRQMAEAARLAGNREAEGRALLLQAYNQERSYQPAEAASTREAAMQVAQEVEDPRLLGLNYYALAFRHYLTGENDLARRYLREASTYARHAQDAGMLSDVLRMGGIDNLFSASYSAAKQALTEAQDWARQGHNSYSRLSSYAWLGLALVEDGRYQEARAMLAEGLVQAADFDESHLLQVRLLNILAYLHREIGDLVQARECSLQAVAAGKRRADTDNVEATCYALLELATTCIHQGQVADAAPYIREFETLSNRSTDYIHFKYMNRYGLLQTELALAQGLFEEALAQATATREAAQQTELRKNVVKCRLYEGQALMGLGHTRDALEPLQQAVALADEIGHGALRWQTRLRLEQAQAGLSDPANVVTLNEALSLVEAIAGQLDDPHLRRCFLNSPLVVELHAAASEPSPVAHPAPENPAGLTAREIEVLRLVAQGLTNRQIGEALHISVRTVNTHVTNILNKSNCDNRTAAAAFAMQHGLAEAASR